MKDKKTNKEVFYVFNHDNVHEYTIIKETTKKGVKITLKRSKTDVWVESVRGTKILTLIDDGNTVTLNKKIHKMDFGELLELRLLLNFEKESDANKFNRLSHKFIKKTEFKEV